MRKRVVRKILKRVTEGSSTYSLHQVQEAERLNMMRFPRGMRLIAYGYVETWHRNKSFAADPSWVLMVSGKGRSVWQWKPEKLELYQPERVREDVRRIHEEGWVP